VSWLNDYMTFTARQESPSIFHYWDAIATVAATLNRRVWLPRVSDGIERYRIFPGQIMVVLVAGAGRLRKSTSIQLPIDLLHDVGVRVLDGATPPEKLLAMLGGIGTHNKQGVIAILAKELSVFLNKQNYSTHMVNILTDLFDAPKRKEFPTIGRGDVWIQNACVTLLAATTPTDWAESIPVSALQRGFSSRIIFVHASKTERVEDLADTKPDPIRMVHAQQLRQNLVDNLKSFAKLTGPFDFTDAGRTWYKNWYANHAKSSDEESEGWSSRRHDHMLRVSLVLQVMKNQQMSIDVDCLERADKALKLVEEGLPEVFAKVGMNQDNNRGLDRIKTIFMRHGGSVDNFTLTEQCVKHFRSFAELNLCIVNLQKSKWIKQVSFEPLTGRQVYQWVAHTNGPLNQLKP